MEVFTSRAIGNHPSSFSRHGFLLSGNSVNLLRYRTSFSIRRNIVPLGLQSRTLRCRGSFQRGTIFEEASNEVNEFGAEKRYGAVAVEDVSPVKESVTSERVSEDESSEDVQTQTLEFLNDVKLDSENTYSILLFGVGALVALYFAYAVIDSVESIPLLPKLLEVVGLGYTFWFTTRYLLFKKNREELSVRIKEIKQQVLGSDRDG